MEKRNEGKENVFFFFRLSSIEISWEKISFLLSVLEEKIFFLHLSSIEISGKKETFFFVSIFDFGNSEKKEILFYLFSISGGNKEIFFFGMKILNLSFKRDLIL